MSRQHTEPLNTPIVQAFGLKRMPFPQELLTRDLFELRTVANVASMMEFSVNCSMFFALIGEVGPARAPLAEARMPRLPRKSADFQSRPQCAGHRARAGRGSDLALAAHGGRPQWGSGAPDGGSEVG